MVVTEFSANADRERSSAYRRASITPSKCVEERRAACGDLPQTVTEIANTCFSSVADARMSFAPGAARRGHAASLALRSATPGKHGTDVVPPAPPFVEHRLQRPTPSPSTKGQRQAIARGTHNLSADHPAKRPAVQQFFRAFGRHPRRMDVLAFGGAFFFEFLRSILEILDGSAPTTKLDQMQRHEAVTP